MAHGSKSPGRNRTHITPRDIRILSLAAKQRFITATDVKCRFYGNKETRNHFTRLKRLVRAGCLEPVMGDNWARLGFRISRKGIHWLPSEELRSKALATRQKGYRTGFDHDRLLLKVQDVFESSGVVSRYLGEHEVRQLLAARHGKKEQMNQGYKVPDGLFQLTTKKVSMTVAVELEMTVKSASRYARIFRELVLSPDFQAVFYVVKNRGMKDLLVQLLAETRSKDLVIQTAIRKNAVYFAVLDDLLEHEKKALFEGENSSFTLDYLAGN